FISAASSTRRDFFENARAIVRNFSATVNARCEDELFCPGLETRGAVRGFPAMLEAAAAMGARLAAGRA
ncbi:MAG: hypothetical protein NT045_09555, partial [Candidatus Aureabacteria bacterium]|nr:hypothetical protein [Candidatus Auribacterota bacterium]